ncbi:acyltransferase family protein [Devosia limi]|uniref:Peptidoglycan/LPS O-acetylase OafA/YrhL, contains acyltransferase and SGNH-hydrolase domains n=1 Tax=Devosia limi DSM 17137 TaxID=1121477 RepID=A0A1M4T6V4_9HYPH|nr:acyltransferase [Devosia limi]SHE40243.1 Peptidoglycan/LPS O-acetylase OafA/YrhL, contains acyltransferase and SGNH-hydrolase domains [Devosia limi DSM 17137]
MRHKFISIQYLRGLAAMLVLASHALLYPLADEQLGFGRLGWLGVILFFAISGFIMVAVTGDGRFSALEFLRRRAIRIVPMYWGATLLAAILALLAPQIFKTTVYDGAELVMSLLFIPFYNPSSGGIHPLYKLGWTLNYEVFFYVCFALLAFLGATARVVWLTLALGSLAVIGLVFQPQGAIPQFYTSFVPLAFCAGAWIGLASLRGWPERIPAHWLLAVLLSGVAGFAEGFLWDRGLVEDGVAFIGFVAFAVALMLLGLRLEPRMPRIALLERIGDASYSIYLVHIYEVAVLSGVAFLVLDRANIWADYLVAAASIVGGTLVGLMLFTLVERPLLQKLSQYRQPASAELAGKPLS